MSDCKHLTSDPHRFPRRPQNRPALSRIGYRIGEYPDMVETMLRHIDGEVALSGWTHRGADDPGIALLEGVGILGDILSFYQERYANEAYLRTAQWRESVAGLVRLMGYRLAPGVGGQATLAVEVKGDKKFTVPAGFPFKTDIEGRDQPAEFQTVADLVAHPHLSKFNLYRPRSYASSLISGTETVEIDQAGSSSALADIAALDLKAGDKLLLLPDAPGWVSNHTAAFGDQDSHQVLEVKEVRNVHDRTIVTFTTGLNRGWSTPVNAYRIGRTFRHFGFAAPESYTVTKPSSGTVTGSTARTANYSRHIREGHSCGLTSMAQNLPGRVIPLDQEVPDLLTKGRVIVETRVTRGSEVKSLILRRRITALRSTTMQFAAQTGPSTLITLNRGLLLYNQSSDDQADIRDYRIHEVTSPRIRLRPKARFWHGRFGSGDEVLNFYGTRREVRKLAGRRISMLHNDGRSIELTCTNERHHFTGGGGDPKMWLLSFDAPPQPFRKGDFDEEAPRVTVFGNVTTGTEGKAVPMEVLGNGDARQMFQTFALPKPVTRHLSPGADPAEVPQLTVYVDGRAWTRVSSFYGQAPDATVYVLMQDDDGVDYVQFGDGQTGARLSSGKGNVQAEFRTGNGARGTPPEGAAPSSTKKIDGLGKMHIPGVVSGGGDPESGDNARLAAPGRVQGLGRIVSLSDYETELLAIPGVSRARALWDISDGVPGVILRVLLESGREAEYEAVRAAINGFQRCRGSNRFALVIEQARLRQVYLDLRCAMAPGLIEEDVRAAITRVLAPMDHADADADGLFALSARRIDQEEYATRIEGCIQQLPQVRWAQVEAFGLFPTLPDDAAPEDLTLPPAPRMLNARVTPGAAQLLQLHSEHLTLQITTDTVAEDCA